MKISLAILAALAVSALAGPLQVSQRTLQDDLKDFLALVPVDKIRETFYEYLEQDPEFQTAFDYLTSEEFTSLLYEIETMPEVKKFMDHLEQLGLPVHEYVNKLNQQLGLEPLPRSSALVQTRTISHPGVKGFFEVIRKMIPEAELEALYKHKLETSKDFKDLVDHLKSPASQEFADKMMSHPKVQAFMKKAEAYGIDVQEILDYLTSMFGLKFPHHYYRNRVSPKYSKQLVMDLKEFGALLPHHEIEALAKKYHHKDPVFHDAINWVDSDQYFEYVEHIESVKEFTDLLSFIEEAGFPAYDAVNGFNHMVGLPDVHPERSSYSEDMGGFSGFLQAVYHLLPHEAIHKLYLEKMEHSPDYKKFVVALGSEHADELVHHLVSHEHFQAFVHEAMKHGIYYREVVDLVLYAFGVNHHGAQLRNVKSLGEELKDFSELIPTYKLVDLFYEYMENDNQFQELVDYVLSEEFADLLHDVESIAEVKSFMKYLHENDVPVYEYINELHKKLGLDPIESRRLFRDDDYYGGVKGFFQQVRKIMPEKQLMALYEEKVKTSKVFAEFMHKLQSKETQDMINKIMKNVHVVKFMEQLKKWDVDFKEVMDMMTELIGVKFPMNY